MYNSNSLETILSYLSVRVMYGIADGTALGHLYYLLEFLAVWEKRPARLTVMAYEWCSAISEVAGALGRGEIPIIQPRDKLQLQLHRLPHWSLPLVLPRTEPLRSGLGFQLRLRQKDPALGEGYGNLSPIIEREFSKVGPGCDPVRLGDASHRTLRGTAVAPAPLQYAHLLSMVLEIGFRLAAPNCDRPTLHSDRTPHHDWMFGAAFSSYDDEVIADAACAWVADRDHASLGSFVRYFAKRVERDTPFSPRLQRVVIRVIELTWRRELKVSGLEMIRLLNRLDVDADDVVEKREWVQLLVDVICSPVGPKSLSSHCWRLLVLLRTRFVDYGSRAMGVARSLEEAEDWEKLEVWMTIAWRSTRFSGLMEDVGQVTFRLLSRQPSALPRFEELCETGVRLQTQRDELRRICDQVRTEQLSVSSLQW